MKRYIKLLIILFIASINFNLFLRPLKLVTGGTQGLGLVISSITNIDVSIIILVVNLLMLIISYIFLSKKSTIGTVISTFVYPLFIKITNFGLINDFNFLYVIISGIVCGITGGIIYKLGFSAGGVNVIPLFFNKYFNIKISISNLIMNLIIIILSCSEFGFVKTIYSLIVISINTIVISKILKSN